MVVTRLDNVVWCVNFALWPLTQIFVVDSTSSEEELFEIQKNLEKCLADPALSTLPFLLLCNKQDLPGARTTEKVCGMVSYKFKGFAGWIYTFSPIFSIEFLCNPLPTPSPSPIAQGEAGARACGGASIVPPQLLLSHQQRGPGWEPWAPCGPAGWHCRPCPLKDVVSLPSTSQNNVQDVG